MLTQMLHLPRQLPAEYFRGYNADYARPHGVVVRDPAPGIPSISISKGGDTVKNRMKFDHLSTLCVGFDIGSRTNFITALNFDSDRLINMHPVPNATSGVEAMESMILAAWRPIPSSAVFRSPWSPPVSTASMWPIISPSVTGWNHMVLRFSVHRLLSEILYFLYLYYSICSLSNLYKINKMKNRLIIIIFVADRCLCFSLKETGNFQGKGNGYISGKTGLPGFGKAGRKTDVP